MPRTQIKCPQCRQPILADIQQLFDINEDPQFKQIFLSGAFNIAQCPHCGFQGMVASPLVYHDLEKELLLTYFPPELALPIHEQEKTIGPLINRVVNNLPQEKRKGYLFNPKTMLTLQLMLETVLEADGITKEMIKAQEDRLNLIQRLLTSPAESQIDIIKQEDDMIDRDFFGLLSRLMEAAAMGQDKVSGKQLKGLQQSLLEYSTRGKELRVEAQEIQAAMQQLQNLGEKITREKLLELVINAPSDTRLEAYARFARQGMDYAFFQMLSERIERARSQGRSRLTDIRDKLLAFTQEVDQELASRVAIARQNVEAVLQAEDIKTTLAQNIQAVDEFFVQAVTQALAEARKAGDLSHSSRLQQVLDAIEELSAPPVELELIEELLKNAGDESALTAAIEAKGEEITPEFLQMLNAFISQTQASLEEVDGENGDQEKEVLNSLMVVYNAALGFSMRKNLKRANS